MVDKLTFQEKEIEKKERLAQTYIVIFGLILASNQSEDTQQYLIFTFFVFLVFIIPYYTFLTNIKNPIKNEPCDPSNLINIFAALSSFVFGIAIVIFTYSVVVNFLFSVTLPLLNSIFGIFTSDFGNCTITLNNCLTIKPSSLLILPLFFSLIQCCLLTIIITYSLVIIPCELKKDNPIDDVGVMIKILKK